MLHGVVQHVDVSYECVQQSLTHTMRYLDALTTQVLKLKATSREERQKAVGLCTFPHGVRGKRIKEYKHTVG